MADEPKIPEIVLQMSVSGGMKWNMPPGAKQVSRKEIYVLLGMVRYSEQILLDMLKTPVKE